MDLKCKIENDNHICVIKNALNSWSVLNNTKEEWCKLFENKSLDFRKGKRSFSNVPQWENENLLVSLSLYDFFHSLYDKSTDEWLYFAYKHIDQLFPGENEFKNAVNWADLGFPELSGKDSTIWIGNEGAHTPCHMDTYGFNLVAQLYGRKLWLLFPPTATEYLKPTRVPYEESSIYSKLNMYTPLEEFLDIPNVYKVILEPGDVLYVPRHWWHYVENLDVAISVNTWIPLEEDDESRLQEVLVQRIVSAMCQNLTLAEGQSLLYTDEYFLLENEPNDNLVLSLINKCKKVRSKDGSTRPRISLRDNASTTVPEIMTYAEKKEYLKLKSHKFGYETTLSKENGVRKNAVDVAAALINSFCHPDVVQAAKEKLVQLL